MKWELRAVMLPRLGDVDGGMWRELMAGMEKVDGYCPESLMMAGLDSQRPNRQSRDRRHSGPYSGLRPDYPNNPRNKHYSGPYSGLRLDYPDYPDNPRLTVRPQECHHPRWRLKIPPAWA